MPVQACALSVEEACVCSKMSWQACVHMRQQFFCEGQTVHHFSRHLSLAFSGICLHRHRPDGHCYMLSLSVKSLMLTWLALSLMLSLSVKSKYVALLACCT